MRVYKIWNVYFGAGLSNLSRQTGQEIMAFHGPSIAFKDSAFNIPEMGLKILNITIDHS